MWIFGKPYDSSYYLFFHVLDLLRKPRLMLLLFVSVSNSIPNSNTAGDLLMFSAKLFAKNPIISLTAQLSAKYLQICRSALPANQSKLLIIDFKHGHPAVPAILIS